ncbi:MAG: hypothetical protein KF832_25435 [Caldilineaceae bacterium]|nr:hypothetical protein [Caldilineaceae bacterium]
MIQLYATILLSLGALVTAFFHLRELATPSAHPARRYWQPLTLMLILLLAMLAPTPIASAYKGAVILAQILVLVGSGLMLLPQMPVAVHKGHWLLAFLLYAAAFTALHTLKWPTLWILLLLVGAGLIAWRLAPRLAELRSTLAVYGVILFWMLWQAVEAVVVIGEPWTWLLLGGAFCLVAAEIIEGFDRFYQRLPHAKLLDAGLLLLGQLLLALSLWGTTLGNRLT